MCSCFFTFRSAIIDAMTAYSAMAFGEYKGTLQALMPYFFMAAKFTWSKPAERQAINFTPASAKRAATFSVIMHLVWITIPS